MVLQALAYPDIADYRFAACTTFYFTDFFAESGGLARCCELRKQAGSRAAHPCSDTLYGKPFGRPCNPGVSGKDHRLKIVASEEPIFMETLDGRVDFLPIGKDRYFDVG